MVLFGLDFGTTFSTVCVYHNGRVLSFKQQNDSNIPTFVFMKDPERTVAVGYDAEILAQSDPSGGFFRDLKRWIGCDEENLEEYKKNLSPHYPVELVTYGSGSKLCVQLGAFSGSKTMRASLPGLIATFVKTLIQTASEVFSVDCSGIICSVPANYNCLQRAFTESSVSLSGYTCVHMINEPSAAALSVSSKLPLSAQHSAVYDFGGGTFDVSIISSVNQSFVVKASGGDMNLGGRDVDIAFAKEIYSLAKLEYNPSLDVSSLKESLSKSTVPISYTVVDVHGNKALVSVTPTLLTRVMKPFVERTLTVLRDVYNRYLLNMGYPSESSSKPKVNIILVGGSSYLPGIKTILSSVDFVSDCVDVSDARAAVAAGCALYTSSISKQSSLSLVDCTSHNLSISAYTGESIVCVPAGAPIPFDGTREIHLRNVTRTSTFTTAVFEGDYLKVFRNKKIFSGSIVLSALGFVNASPATVPVTLEVAVSSVGTIEFTIQGPNNIKVKIGDQTAYNFVGKVVPQRSLVDLHKRNVDRVLLHLSLTRDGNQRFRLTEEEVERLASSINFTDPLHSINTFSAYDEQQLHASRILLGKSVQKLLRGSRLAEIPS